MYTAARGIEYTGVQPKPTLDIEERRRYQREKQRRYRDRKREALREKQKPRREANHGGAIPSSAWLQP